VVHFASNHDDGLQPVVQDSPPTSVAPVVTVPPPAAAAVVESPRPLAAADAPVVAAAPAPPPDVDSQNKFPGIEYVVDYTPPTVDVSVAMVDVTFFAPTDESLARRILWAEMRKAIAQHPPTTDVIGGAWLHKQGTSKYEDRQFCGGGDDDPIYDREHDRLMTWAEFHKLPHRPS
jgi:hypothetical protein